MKNRVYENVVFAQGEDATEPLEILADKGAQAAIDYLSQWHDCGKHEMHDAPGGGSEDRTYITGDYILSWNYRLAYIGLEHKLYLKR